MQFAGRLVGQGAVWSGLVGVAAGLMVQVPCVLAQPPSLSFVVPAAVVPGQPTDVTLYGGALEGAVGVWTSAGAAAELTPGLEGNGQEGGKVSFRITAGAGTPEGICGIRVATGRGVSEVRLLAIDSLPAVVENGANKTRDTAQEVTLPVAIDGASEAESFDYFKFTAHAGQRVTIEALAQRLGSPLDPVIRLLDQAGNELAYSDDEPGIGSDSRLAYEIPAEGTYLLEVGDIRYQGSGGHRYRLRLGDFPLVNVAYPLAAQRGTSAELGLVGPSVDGSTVIRTTVDGTAPERLRLTIAAPEGQGSTWAGLLVEPLPEAIELEPNDAPEAASPVSVPGGVSGRFETPQDRDYFQFTPAAGQRLLLVGQTRTLGSPTDLFLRLYKEDGTLLAEADDSGGNEGVIDFTFPEAANYRLMVEDLNRRGGPEHAYRVAIVPYSPGFSLAAETDRFNAPQGGVFVAKVTVARRDYAGPITLSLEGAPEGTSLAGETIAENANETVLRVTLPASAAPGSLLPLKIRGQATIGEATVRSVASNLAQLRGLLSGLPSPPAELDGALALGVGPAFGEFIKLSTDVTPAEYPQLVGSATLKVKVEKLQGFDDVVALAVEGLPAGYAAEVKNIEKGQAEAELIIRGPLVPALGSFQFRVVGAATHQEQPGRAATEVAVRVIRPLKVQVAPSGPLTAGGTQPVKITVTRFAGSTAPVTLRWTRLPLGVTGATEMVLGEGQSELETPLTAAADAMLGETPLELEAVSVVSGRQISATSEAAKIEVKMP